MKWCRGKGCFRCGGLGDCLSQRGEADTLVLATGTGRAGEPFLDCVRHPVPGDFVGRHKGSASGADLFGTPGTPGARVRCGCRGLCAC